MIMHELIVLDMNIWNPKTVYKPVIIIEKK